MTLRVNAHVMSRFAGLAKSSHKRRGWKRGRLMPTYPLNRDNKCPSHSSEAAWRLGSFSMHIILGVCWRRSWKISQMVMASLASPALGSTTVKLSREGVSTSELWWKSTSMEKKNQPFQRGFGRRICLHSMNVGGILELGGNCSDKLQHIQCLLKIHDFYCSCVLGEVNAFPNNESTVSKKWTYAVYM